MLEKIENISNKRFTALGCLVIFISVFIVFGNTLTHDYNLDDSYYIQLLPEEGSSFKAHLSAVNQWFSKSNYRPIPTLHLSLEQYVFGQKPAIFHSFSLLYFALLCLLILWIFDSIKLFKSRWAIAGVVLIFIIHPAHSNVVSSIKNRESILCMLYGLIAVCFMLRFASRRKILWLFPSLIFLLCSMACKLDGFLFAGLGALLIHFKMEGLKLPKALGISALLMIISTVLFIVLTNNALEASESQAITEYYENPMINTPNVLTRYLQNLGLSIHYHKFMVIPSGYYFYFGFNQLAVPNTSSFAVISIAIITLFLMLLSFWFLRSGSKSNSLLGFLIYGLFLAPYIILMDQMAGIIAVRYTFNATLGFSILLIAIIVLVLGRMSKPFRTIPLVVFSAFVLYFGYKAHQRNEDWADKETLFSTDLVGLSNSYMANRMAGIFFLSLTEQSNRSEKAKKLALSKASKYLLEAGKTYENDPVLYQYLGKLTAQTGKYKEAFTHFKKAVELDSSRADSWMLYGDFCSFSNDLSRAENAYRSALLVDYDNIAGIRGLSFALIDQGKIEDAIHFNQDLLNSNVQREYAFENMAHAFLAMGDTSQTLYYFQEAFRNGLDNQGLERMVYELDLKFRE